MTYNDAKLRSAITAVAAVFALSSTPLFAQDTGPADTTAETPPTADPLAPEPVAEPAPTATETTTETAAEPPPAPRPKVESAQAKAQRASTSRTTRQARSAAPPPAATPVAEVPVAAAPPPVAETRPVAEPIAPTPVETPPAAEPATPIPTDLADALMTDERLQVGGGAAAGLLAIAAAAMAIRRRKRRKEEEQLEEAKWAIIEAPPEVESQAEPEPAFARAPAPVHDPVPPARTPAQAKGPATKLPDGFDLSQFGRHVQAAYRGPTPDNPSVSLEYRLRRATFLDQKEQDAREAAARAAKVPSKGNWETRSDADFLFRRAGAKNNAKPEYQG